MTVVRIVSAREWRRRAEAAEAENARLRAELDDASEHLRLHQTLGDYETGYRAGTLAASNAVAEMRTVNERLRAEIEHLTAAGIAASTANSEESAS